MTDGTGSAPGGPPTRHCPVCGTQSQTWSDRCPACDSLFAPPRLSPRARRLAALAAVGLTVGAAAYAGPRIDTARERQAIAAARDAAAMEARERARVSRDQVPVSGRLAAEADDPALPLPRRLGIRRALVAAFEHVVRDDAQRRFRAGTADGPVTGAVCRPLVHTHGGRRDDRDARRPVGRFECLATTLDVRAHGRRVGVVGQPYVGALHFRSAAYVLCKYHPPPGEGGVMLAQVPLHPLCFGARDAAELAALGIREAPRD